MTITSPFQSLDIPKIDLLSYVFPKDRAISDDPVWIDAANPSNSLSPRQALSWIKRLALGLDRLGVGEQEVVMIMSPNHIFVPVMYLGIVGSRRIFSAGNPIYTVSGKCCCVAIETRQRC
jgi:4-coumarate--CoA ligase